MTKDKVTRDALRAMAMGETRTFHLEDALEIYSGQTQVSQMQRILKCRFTVQSDFENSTITITKNP